MKNQFQSMIVLLLILVQVNSNSNLCCKMPDCGYCCTDAHKIDGLTCVCDVGYYQVIYTSFSSLCQSCRKINGCQTCLDANTCIVCQNGYGLNTINQRCQKCNKLCQKCITPYDCSFCVSNALKNNDGKCQCKEGYQTKDVGLGPQCFVKPTPTPTPSPVPVPDTNNSTNTVLIVIIVVLVAILLIVICMGSSNRSELKKLKKEYLIDYSKNQSIS